MFSSFMNSDIDTDEVPAKSSLPWVFFGFVFAFAFLVAETLDVALDLDHDSFRLLLMLIAICGWIYWLVCVYRLHSILNQMSRGRYPISPGEAVGRHFIPIYNFIWIFKWPREFSEYLNQRGRVKVVPGAVLGGLLLLAALLRFFDGAIGLAALFGVSLYINAKLRRHMKLVKGVTPDMLPPPPDAGMFRQAPVNSEPGESPAGPASATQP